MPELLKGSDCKNCGHPEHKHSKGSGCNHDFSISDWEIDICPCREYVPIKKPISAIEFLDRVDWNFRCSCGVERTYFIDLLVHPHGFCKCICGASTIWTLKDSRVSFSHRVPLIPPNQGGFYEW